MENMVPADLAASLPVSGSFGENSVQPPNRVKVVHSVECWLPQTATWLFNHVRSLPKEFESSVVCQWTQNLRQFPIENLYSLEKPPETPSLLRRLSSRLCLQEETKRHLPLLNAVIPSVQAHVLHSHFGHVGSLNATLAKKYDVPHIVSFMDWMSDTCPASGGGGFLATASWARVWIWCCARGPICHRCHRFQHGLGLLPTAKMR